MLMLLVLPVGSDHSDLAPALDILALIGGRLTSLGVLLSESVVCLFVCLSGTVFPFCLLPHTGGSQMLFLSLS